MHFKPIRIAAALTAVGLLTTGCLSANKPAATSAGPETAKAEVTVMYAFSGDQSKAFQADMNKWAAANGVKIAFVQSDSFEEMIQTKVASGNAPDNAIFPQPGILQAQAKAGKLAEASSLVDLAKVKADIVPGFLEAGMYNGKEYGLPMAMNGKSFYWYNKPAFEAAGYAVPETHDDLLDVAAVHLVQEFGIVRGLRRSAAHLGGKALEHHHQHDGDDYPQQQILAQVVHPH